MNSRIKPIEAPRRRLLPKTKAMAVGRGKKLNSGPVVAYLENCLILPVKGSLIDLEI